MFGYQPAGSSGGSMVASLTSITGISSRIGEGGRSRWGGGPRVSPGGAAPPGRSRAGLLSSPGAVFSGLGLASRFAAGLRARRFDVALDFHGTFKSGLVSLASGALLRYGF